MIDVATLRMMRQEAAKTLQSTCTIFRKTGDTVVKGIPKPTYDEGTATPCTPVLADTSAEVQADGKLVAIAKSYFILPVVTLSNADYISFSGKTFNIIEAPAVGEATATLEAAVQRRS